MAVSAIIRFPRGSQIGVEQALLLVAHDPACLLSNETTLQEKVREIKRAREMVMADAELLISNGTVDLGKYRLAKNHGQWKLNIKGGRERGK